MTDDSPCSFQTICRTDDVPAGGAKLFVVAEMMLGIFHVGGQFFALANECPHAGASLAHGNIEGDIVSCRIHHWRFSIRDGTYLDANKPECNARTYPVRVIDGEVQVAIDSKDLS